MIVENDGRVFPSQLDGDWGQGHCSGGADFVGNFSTPDKGDVTDGGMFGQVVGNVR